MCRAHSVIRLLHQLPISTLYGGKLFTSVAGLIDGGFVVLGIAGSKPDRMMEYLPKYLIKMVINLAMNFK